MKKMDYIFAIAVVICAVSIWLTTFYLHRAGDYIEVVLDDEVIAQYSLLQDGEYPIYTTDSDYNILSIHDGQAKVMDANCPDKLCAKQHAISKMNETIICLPHQLVFRVISSQSDSSDYDAIAN